MGDYKVSLDNSDDGKPQEVALYEFSYFIGHYEYGGHIPAISHKDAQAKVGLFGAVVTGRLVCAIPEQGLCAKCMGNLEQDLEHPEAIGDNIFDDEITFGGA